MEQKFYTLLVYSENIAGILNQVTAVFTRRQVNIESLNVSASSIDGIHKYTITCWSTEDQIVKITRHDARMMEVNPTYSTVMQTGLTEDIADLFKVLNGFNCLLQYTRSGRIAVTRSFEEPVSDFLNRQE